MRWGPPCKGGTRIPLLARGGPLQLHPECCGKGGRRRSCGLEGAQAAAWAWNEPNRNGKITVGKRIVWF